MTELTPQGDVPLVATAGRRGSRVEEAVQELRLAIVRLEGKVGQALHSRTEFNRKVDLLTTQVETVASRLRLLEDEELREGTQRRVWVWFREHIFEVIIALIGTGVYFHGR